MRTIKMSILATVFALGAGISSTNAQTADDIIKKHIEAVGGEENWNKVKSIKLVGSASAQGQDIGFTQTTLNNKGMRTDINFMGTAGYIIITPKEGWMFMPFGGQQTTPQSLPMDQIKSQMDEINVKHLQYADKSFFPKCELAGTDTINQVACYKLKIKGDDLDKTLYIDSKSYYLVRSEMKVKVPGGEDQEVSQDFSNFKKQSEGITIPMTISNPMMGGDINFKTVEINKPVDEKIFKPDTK